jgi:hypothetical protein
MLHGWDRGWVLSGIALGKVEESVVARQKSLGSDDSF